MSIKNELTKAKTKERMNEYRAFEKKQRTVKTKDKSIGFLREEQGRETKKGRKERKKM